MNKIFYILPLLLTVTAQANNSDWFKKVPQHLRFGTYLGKTNLFKRCSLTLAPSDKKGVIASIEATRISDVLGSQNKTLASLHILPTDTLTGSSRYPNAPYESQTVLSFGYEDAALIIENMNASSVKVTIEEYHQGKMLSKSCTVDVKNK